MPTTNLVFKFRKNNPKNVLTPSELKGLYFFGIPIQDQAGNLLSDQNLSTMITQAQEEMEGFLNLKLFPQIIEETKDFFYSETLTFGFVGTSYPVHKVFELQGAINTTAQITWPSTWLVTRTTNDKQYNRAIHIVPGDAVTPQTQGVQIGFIPYIGLRVSDYIPQYWKATYCTGFQDPPQDIVSAIGQLAAIKVFHQLGDLILGAGIASQSLSIDGLSQSISTTSSATNAGYGARIQGYLADLKISLQRLKNKYDGFEITAL